MTTDETPGVYRRTLLRAIATSSVGAALTGVGAAASDHDFVLQQGGREHRIRPLSGDQPVEVFYDYRIPFDHYTGTIGATDPGDGPYYESAGTRYLKRESTTLTFLYDGPNGLSLVVVHDKAGGDGGSATMRFTGTIGDADWFVRDDQYLDLETREQVNFDRWSTDGTTHRVDWTWSYRHGDGGVLGYLDNPMDIAVDPAFNEAAALWNEHYEGTVEAWHFLSGDILDPDRIELSRNDPIRVRSASGGTQNDDSVDSTEPDREKERGRGKKKGKERGRGKGKERGRGKGKERGRGKGKERGRGKKKGKKQKKREKRDEWDDDEDEDEREKRDEWDDDEDEDEREKRDEWDDDEEDDADEDDD